MPIVAHVATWELRENSYTYCDLCDHTPTTVGYMGLATWVIRMRWYNMASTCPTVRLIWPMAIQESAFYPSALRAGGVLSSRSGRSGGRAGGCQTCGTHISVTAWWIFSVRSSMELSRPVVVHCHAHLPICPIWACPWAENLSNLPQIGSRLCGSHISETAGWIYPI